MPSCTEAVNTGVSAILCRKMTPPAVQQAKSGVERLRSEAVVGSYETQHCPSPGRDGKSGKDC